MSTGDFMPGDTNLKQLALDEIIAQSLPKTDGQRINEEFYKGVPSPIETDVTGKGEPLAESPTPFQDMYAKEFAPGDELYKKAMTGEMWQRRNQGDQGPGTVGYKKDSPEEQARMFGAKLQEMLKKGRTP
jgi:hypothetical protein